MVDETLSELVIQENDVSNLLKSLDTNKATGPDQISQMMLKQAGDTIVGSLTKLFNISLSTAQYPSQWKKAHIIPIW